MDFLSNKEGVMKDADRVWKMLDDMSQNDPDGYKKFIDKNLVSFRVLQSFLPMRPLPNPNTASLPIPLPISTPK